MHNRTGIRKIKSCEKAARMKTDKRSQPQIKNGDILLTEIGLLNLAKTSFDHVNEFHTDPEYYKLALGIAYDIPSESTFKTEEKGEMCIRAVYEIIDRIMDPNGQMLFDTESEINLYLPSLELSDEKVFECFTITLFVSSITAR